MAPTTLHTSVLILLMTSATVLIAHSIYFDSSADVYIRGSEIQDNILPLLVWQSDWTDLDLLLPSVAVYGQSDTQVPIMQSINATKIERDGKIIHLGTRDRFGASVAAIGDIDGNGVVDFAVGRSYIWKHGAVDIIHMEDHNTIKSTFRIDSSDKRSVYIPNGPSHDTDDHFGFSVAAIGDIDSNGVPDLAVGAPGDDGPSNLGFDENNGVVYILLMEDHDSIKSTSKLSNVSPNGPSLTIGDYFGASVAAIGDIDGNGVVDFVVGAINHSHNGAFYILLMEDHDSIKSSHRFTYEDISQKTGYRGNSFGYSVAHMGDINGDGTTEIAVGAPCRDYWYEYNHRCNTIGKADIARNPPGSVFLVSVSYGTSVSATKMAELRHGLEHGPILIQHSKFGASVANVGDLDGDGVNDMAIGAPYVLEYPTTHKDAYSSETGTVYLMLLNSSGLPKATIPISNDTVPGIPDLQPNEAFGRSLASPGDMNGDGTPDIVVGSPRVKTDGRLEAGAIRIIPLDSLVGPLKALVPPPPAPPVVGISASSDGTGDDVTFTIDAKYTSPTQPAPVTINITLIHTGSFVSPDELGPRTVTIPASGTLSITVPIINNDAADGQDGTLTLRLENGDGYTVLDSGSTRSVDVRNDDDRKGVSVHLTAQKTSVLEGKGKTKFTISLSRALEKGETVKVPFDVTGGDAREHWTVRLLGDDKGVKRTSGGAYSTVVFSNGAQSATFALTAKSNSDTADRTIVVSLGTGDRAPTSRGVAGGVTLSDNTSFAVEIMDDDKPVSISIAAQKTYIMEDKGKTKFTISLSRQLGSGETIKVPFDVTGGDAREHWFVKLNGSKGVERTSSGSQSKIKLTEGARSATFELVAKPNSDTADRTIVVSLGTGDRAPTSRGVAGGVTLSDNTSFTVYIIDDDKPPPTMEMRGDNPTSAPAGLEYDDPGAACTDYAGKPLAVVTSSSVNTSVPGTYLVSYSCTDMAKKTASATRTVIVSDSTKPIITLNGQSSIVLEVGDSYVDAGAVCVDNVDGKISPVRTGNVDTSARGTYAVSYSCVDAAGNEASATRTVIVSDSTKPIITLNGQSSIVLEVGDSYVDAGAVCVDNVDGKISPVRTGNVDTSARGTYSVTYTCVDAAGNSAVPVTRIIKTIFSTAQPTVSVEGGMSVDEGGILDFVVSLSHQYQYPVDVYYVTVPWCSATAGSDYVHTDDFVRFEPGQTEHTVGITTIQDEDGIQEGDETVCLEILLTVNYVLSSTDYSAEGTITEP